MMTYRLLVFMVLLLAYQPIVRADDEAPWRWKAGRMPDLGFDLDRAQVIRVTSLESRGEGTLRAALDGEGPRIVVFDIAGVIDLEERAIKIDHDEVVVAGQTAPSPGAQRLAHGKRLGCRRWLGQ
jgi:hypothetical protein